MRIALTCSLSYCTLCRPNLLNMTDVLVKLNEEPRKATIIFADRRDLGFIDGWREKLGADDDTKRRDALEMAQLAIDSFIAHSSVQQLYVNSTEQIATHIKDDEKNEIAGFVLLKCDWFPDSEVIGISHFRRSWCHSIILDYLAVHPFIANYPKGYPYAVSGAGSALLWFISDIARRYGCRRIWGEATHSSSSYYTRMFVLDSPVEDLILVPRLNYIECAKLELGWRADSEANTMKAASVDELYKVEAENPPLVGRRSFVVSPSRKLAYHFLELPRQAQTQIVRDFGLAVEGEEERHELFRTLFQRATESGKLGDLWNAVEEMHPKGRPEENPFRQA
jgi:hypothetical protein